MTNFLRFDTNRADGFYVKFERVESHDDTANPNDYLFQDADYRDEDQARLDAWRRDEWSFIGIQAVAHCELISNGMGTMYTLTSPGLWGIESDSGEEYLSGVFEQECNTLKADIAAMTSPIYE